MMIKDLFVKPIDRDIKGVIKVGKTTAPMSGRNWRNMSLRVSCKSTLQSFSPATSAAFSERPIKWVCGSPASSEVVNLTF